MVVVKVETLYEREIRPLEPADRLRLLALIAADLAEVTPPPSAKRSILELEGLGAELWEGVDPQEYVHALREEWDQRP